MKNSLPLSFIPLILPQTGENFVKYQALKSCFIYKTAVENTNAMVLSVLTFRDSTTPQNHPALL